MTTEEIQDRIKEAKVWAAKDAKLAVHFKSSFQFLGIICAATGLFFLFGVLVIPDIGSRFLCLGATILVGVLANVCWKLRNDSYLKFMSLREKWLEVAEDWKKCL